MLGVGKTVVHHWRKKFVCQLIKQMSGVWSSHSAFPFDAPQTGARRRASRKVRRAGQEMEKVAGQAMKAGQEMEEVAGQAMKAGQVAAVKAGQMKAVAGQMKTAGRRLKKTAKKAKKGARRH